MPKRSIKSDAPPAQRSVSSIGIDGDARRRPVLVVAAADVTNVCTAVLERAGFEVTAPELPVVETTKASAHSMAAADALARLRTAAATALAQPDLQAKLDAQGVETRAMSDDALAQFTR